MFKRLKFVYQLYNFFHKKNLEYNVPLYKKYGLKKKYYSSVSSMDFEKLKDETNWLDEKNSRTELPANEFFNSLEPRFQEALLSWSDKGYAILPSYFSEEEVDKANSIIKNLVDSKKANWQNGNKIMFALHQSDFLKENGQ